MGKNFIYKIVPFSNWQIAEYEKWLSDLAQEGLILQKVGFLWAKFKRSEPQQLTYRIDISNTKLSLQLKEQYGWESIDTSALYSIYVSSKVNQDAELMENREETITQLKSRNLGNKVCLGVMGVLILFAIFILLKSDVLGSDTPLLSFFRDSGIDTYFLLIVGQLIMGSIVFAEYKGTRRLIKALETNGHIDRKNIHTGIRDKLLNKSRLIGSIGFLIIVGCTVGYDERINLNDIQQPIPIVRLESLEHSEMVLDETNRCERNWNPFLKENYEVDEQGTIQGSHVKRDSPYIYTELYDLRFEEMKNTLVEDIKQYRENEGLGIEQVDGLDELHLLRNSDSIEVIAVKGKKIMFVRYRGNEGKERLLEEIVKVMGSGGNEYKKSL